MLEINTNRSKLKEVVEKIIKAKLRTNLPLIMNASNLLYKAGDIEDDMVAIYDANLEKVLVVFLLLLDLKKKRKLMEEWWGRTHGLLMEGGPTYESIKQSVANDIIEEVLRQKLKRSVKNVKIVTYKETKLSRQDVTADLVMVDGYESFFSSTRTSQKGRTGYSGVITFLSSKVCFFEY